MDNLYTITLHKRCPPFVLVTEIDVSVCYTIRALEYCSTVTSKRLVISYTCKLNNTQTERKKSGPRRLQRGPSSGFRRAASLQGALLEK